MCFFQSKAYFELMNGLPGVEPFSYSLSEQSGDSSASVIGMHFSNGGIVKQYLSSRIVVLGEPKLNEFGVPGLPDETDWQFTKQLNRKSIYSELRLLEPAKNKDFFNSLSYTHRIPYLNILVDTTPTAEILYSNLSSTRKRQVQSSTIAGALVRPARSEDEVESFYLILEELYVRKIKKPLLQKEVFLRIFRNKNIGEIFVVLFNEKVIGGMLCPFDEKNEIYEWYIGCRDEEMKKHKVYPSVLVTWEVIKYASVNGFSRFNFMGAGIKGKPYGVRDFKMQFGGELVDAPRYIFVHKPLLYKLGKLAVKLGFGN